MGIGISQFSNDDHKCIFLSTRFDFSFISSLILFDQTKAKMFQASLQFHGKSATPQIILFTLQNYINIKFSL